MPIDQGHEGRKVQRMAARRGMSLPAYRKKRKDGEAKKRHFEEGCNISPRRLSLNSHFNIGSATVLSVRVTSVTMVFEYLRRVVRRIVIDG